jgi:hypothetical protein
MFWIQHERRFSSHGMVNLPGRNLPLLDEAVGNDHEAASVKKVEHPVVNSLQTDPKLVDAIAQQVRFRPAEFMAQFGEPFQANTAFVLGLRVESIEPFQEWHPAVCVLKKYDGRFGHRQLYSRSVHVRIFANIGQWLNYHPAKLSRLTALTGHALELRSMPLDMRLFEFIPLRLASK